MKRLVSILFSIATCYVVATACGPYHCGVPEVDYFAYYAGNDRLDRDEHENLLLWQRMTSHEIPLEDIKQAVYKYDSNKLNELFYGYESTDNKFIRYIVNTGRHDIYDFLELAKDLSEAREAMQSPWYYPSSRYADNNETGDFGRFVEQCEDNAHTPLGDRYALQAVRALFASKQYDRCTDYYERYMSQLPADNLFKRMAMGYIAGCRSRLGDIDRANEYFAQAGNFNSIRSDNPVALMARYHPDNPEMMSYIHGDMANNDTIFMKKLKPIALETVVREDCIHKADWYFVLAYIAHVYENNHGEALRYVQKALRSKPSNADNLAVMRLFRMKLDAERGDMSRLHGDLRWIDAHVGPLSPLYASLDNVLRNMVYTHWVPQLMARQDYTTAVLLAGFADRYRYRTTRMCDYRWMGPAIGYKPFTYLVDELVKDPTLYNSIDYGSLSFRLMGSLSSGRLISVYKEMYDDDPLWNFLRRYARVDRNYIKELIGTLALREERYDRAVSYLSAVGPEYQEFLNIYKEGYLSRDPFIGYNHEDGASVRHLPSPRDAKLNFARRMLGLQQLKRNGPTADERAMAAIDYAIGLRNSFEECWALTQYWRGEYVPTLTYPMYDADWSRLDYIYEYDNTDEVEARYRRQVEEAMAAFGTDEGRAAALVRTGRYRSAVRLYPDTPTAATIKRSCDNWRDWL